LVSVGGSEERKEGDNRGESGGLGEGHGWFVR
jgi:hypothetical protein